MTGIEVEPRGERTGARICRRARDHGVLVRPLGDVVVLMPPLAIGDDDLEHLVTAVTAATREVLHR
jgi:adenosylmethionine-8-amino-7-oxononanoate aminotransferase